MTTVFVGLSLGKTHGQCSDHLRSARRSLASYVDSIARFLVLQRFSNRRPGQFGSPISQTMGDRLVDESNGDANRERQRLRPEGFQPPASEHASGRSEIWADGLGGPVKSRDKPEDRPSWP